MAISKKELSRLQKNARNKLYRLRKKGIINAQLNQMAVPVKSWDEVQTMSVREQNAYARQLREFNSRENRIETQGQSLNYVLQRNSNIALPYEKVLEYRIAEAERNIIRAERRARLEKIRENVELNKPDDVIEAIESITKNLPEKISREDFGRGGAENLVAQVEPRNTPFKSLKQLENAIKGYTRAVKNAPKTDEALTRQNKGYISTISNRLSDEGYLTEELANILDNLSDDQIFYLYYYTEFDALTSVYRYQRDYDEGRVGFSEDTKGSNYDTIWKMLNIVKNI
jgi:vacuolar-type H+-ATPase subunit I/STV1